MGGGGLTGMHAIPLKWNKFNHNFDNLSIVTYKIDIDPCKTIPWKSFPTITSYCIYLVSSGIGLFDKIVNKICQVYYLPKVIFSAYLQSV